MATIRKVYVVECRLRGQPVPGDSFTTLKEAKKEHWANKRLGLFSAIWKMSYKRERLA